MRGNNEIGARRSVRDYFTDLKDAFIDNLPLTLRTTVAVGIATVALSSCNGDVSAQNTPNASDPTKGSDNPPIVRYSETPTPTVSPTPTLTPPTPTPTPTYQGEIPRGPNVDCMKDTPIGYLKYWADIKEIKRVYPDVFKITDSGEVIDGNGDTLCHSDDYII